VPEWHVADARRDADRRHLSVPKLCATDSLEPFGSCRLCLVEIEGRKGYPCVVHHARPRPA
jgi:predicted molibdopterin-dependent oxidoreductase YjgC